MNRNEFLNIIRNTGQIDRQTMGEVRELLDIFPWFQSAHLLLLKGLHNTEDVKFETQLKKSAVFVADREILYYLLTASGKEKKEPPVDEIRQPVILADAPDNLQVVIETGKSSHDIISELEGNQYFAGNSPGDSDDMTLKQDHEIIIASESETDESASLVLMTDDGDTHRKETVVFMDPSISVSDHVELLELDDESPEGLTETRVPDFKESAENPDINEEKSLSQSELIDRFIMSNPRIEPNRDKTAKALEDISVKFVEEKSGFVTETLAKIYIAQGYYSRAIEIYEKLSLKYPEKSSYFAAQIEKIKELIK
jgi:hypothetical protein